jgi:thiamine-phosphate pyrophosphorylase
LRFNLPKIYPITDTGLAGISHTEQVHSLVLAGARLIQLRFKGHAGADLIKDLAEAVRVGRANACKILINDRVDIALAIGADGVHLGQSDLPPAEARRLLGPTAIVGSSTHNDEQVAAALSEPIDYIAFGPIFSTSTKIDHDPVVGMGNLSRTRQAAGEKPLVAIGGITLDNFRSVLAAGADSVAIISDLYAAEDGPGERYRVFAGLSE